MKRGDVVEVDWPYSDLTGSKVRPAVVVQADFLNGLLDDTVLVQITSTRHGIPGTEVVLDPAQELSSGLNRICVASCVNFLTLDQTIILRTVGYLSATVMQQIDDCLKKVLGLP
jgi:mRNA interferase MazF